MEQYLMITQINDFIFCPRSIYFHNILRDNFSPTSYREQAQIDGLNAHKAIDSQTYSSQKKILQGTMIYSSKYNLLGRIDLFDIERGILTERKYSITAIYDGFRYQLYAQYFALIEMHYSVKELVLYSKKDNKSYKIPLPDAEEIKAFENILQNIKNYTINNDFSPNTQKCINCNYREICDLYEMED